MKRRDWLKQIGVGSAALLSTTPTRANSAVDFESVVYEVTGTDDIVC